MFLCAFTFKRVTEDSGAGMFACNVIDLMSTLLYRSVHLHFQTVGQKGCVLVVPNIVHYRNQAVVNLLSLDVSV